MNGFDRKAFFKDHADIFFLRIVDRGATYGLQNKSLYLDPEGKISMWSA